MESDRASIPSPHPAVLSCTAWTLAMESLIGSGLPSSAPRPRCDRGQLSIFLAHGVLATFCKILEQVKWPQAARQRVRDVCVCEYVRGLSYAIDRKYDIDICISICQSTLLSMSLYLCIHAWFRGITGPAPFLQGNEKYIHHRSYLPTYLSTY